MHGATGIGQPITVHVGNPSANNPPFVRLVSPADGATYQAVADFWAGAYVTDPNGDAITKVEFLVGTTVVAEDTTAPYIVPVKLRAAGLYNVWVRASDEHGAIGESDMSAVTIIQPAANALNSICYASLPANTFGQAASVDSDDASGTGWITYSNLVFDASNCATMPTIDGRLPFIWWDETNGLRALNQWYGASLEPASVTLNGLAYPVPLPFFDWVEGIGSGHFICLAPDCGLQSGYGHILAQLFTDADNDGVPNASDNCQIYANDQVDSSVPPDGIGDACDGRDSDNDAYRDYDDAYPNNPSLH